MAVAHGVVVLEHADDFHVLLASGKLCDSEVDPLLYGLAVGLLDAREIRGRAREFFARRCGRCGDARVAHEAIVSLRRA